MTDELPALPAETEEVRPPPWSLLRRFLFRFGLIYFLLYSHPFPLDAVPDPARVAQAFELEWPYAAQTDWLQEGISGYSTWVAARERDAVDWTARHLFGFDELLDRPMGSGDPTYSYVRLLLLLVLALLAASTWSLLDQRPRAYRKLPAWLQLDVRFYLAFILLGYGFAKVHPSQFRFPGLGRLVTPYGDASPMNVLWSFMGSSTAYIVFSGAAEVLAGLLLCFRRTATLGALAAVAVMTNVVAMNYCYDVPVKLFSTHLLVFAALLCLPDLRRLLDTFVLNRPTLARDLSLPRLPYFGHVVKLLVVGTSLVVSVKGVVDRYSNPPEPAALHGIWDVASHREDGVELAPLTTDPRRWNALLIEWPTFGWIQSMNGSLRGVSLAYDEEADTLTLSTSATWRYRSEADGLILQGEFARRFRADPTDFQAPGEPRDPQVELALVRVEQEPEEERLPLPEAPEDELPTHALEGADEPTTPTEPATPMELRGRWSVVRDEVVGDVATRRRSDPTGWVAVRFEPRGTAQFEYAGGETATYHVRADPEEGSLVFTSSAALSITPDEAGGLSLSGELRGHQLEVDLRPRDLESFLLVRRGYHWINEIPLNRY